MNSCFGELSLYKINFGSDKELPKKILTRFYTDSLMHSYQKSIKGILLKKKNFQTFGRVSKIQTLFSRLSEKVYLVQDFQFLINRNIIKVDF
jgi:hypothetical protein